MIRFWLVLTIVFLLFSACKTQNKTQNFNWKEFVSDEGRFKATFPFVPVKSVKEVAGNLQSYKFEISLAEPEIYFGVWYADFPSVPVMTEDALRTNYDNIRNGFSKQEGIELISDRDVWVNEKLGREIILKDAKQVIVTYRMFLIGNRQYQVMTSTKLKDAEIKRSIDKFLDSFKLIEN